MTIKVRFCFKPFYLEPNNNYSHMGSYLNFPGNADSCFVIISMLWIMSSTRLTSLLFGVRTVEVEIIK